MTPTLDMSTPAMAGPRMRERLNCVELSARAGPICARGTMDGTIDWNDGMESASVTPTTTESAMIIHGVTPPVISRITIAVGHSIWIDWKIVITRRRSERSASAPPTRVSSHTGAFMAKESRPIRNDDAPRVSSSHGSATCWAQVPMLESRLANQKVPKRRVASRRSDSPKVRIMGAPDGLPRGKQQSLLHEARRQQARRHERGARVSEEHADQEDRGAREHDPGRPGVAPRAER